MKPRRNIWQTGWRLGICFLLLLWIFHTIFLQEGQRSWTSQGHDWSNLTRAEQWQVAWSQGPRELWRTLRLVQPGFFLLSLVFMGMTILLGLLRWRRVLHVQGLKLSLGRTAEISLVAHFFNSFLLGSTGGDLLKAYYAAQETHHKKTEAIMTVAVDRLLGLFSMLLFACFMMLPNLDLLAAHGRLAAVAWFIVAMLGGCAVVVVVSLWGGVSKGWPQARAWLRRLPKGDFLERALEACRHFGRQPRFLLEVLGLSMALNLFCVLQAQALAWGLGLALSPVTLLVIVPVIVCISALPITPSGLGVRENLYVLMLAAPEINIEPTRALSLSLLAYAGSLIWSIAGGIVYIASRERHHLPKIKQADSVAP